MKQLIVFFSGARGRFWLLVLALGLVFVGGSTRDDRAWTAVCGSQSEAALEQFLDDFPASPFVPAAQAALRSVRWDAVRTMGSNEELSAFLLRYPTGAFADQLHVLQVLEVEPSLLVAFP